MLDRYQLRELLVAFAYCLAGILVFWMSFELLGEIDELKRRDLGFGEFANAAAQQGLFFGQLEAHDPMSVSVEDRHTKAPRVVVEILVVDSQVEAAVAAHANRAAVVADKEDIVADAADERRTGPTGQRPGLVVG